MNDLFETSLLCYLAPDVSQFPDETWSLLVSLKLMLSSAAAPSPALANIFSTHMIIKMSQTG